MIEFAAKERTEGERNKMVEFGRWVVIFFWMLNVFQSPASSGMEHVLVYCPFDE